MQGMSLAKNPIGQDIWYVYMVRCADGSLYTGIAKDTQRRIQEHNQDAQLGARYTRARRPVKLVYEERYENRSQATKREAQIKRLKKHEKENLLRADGSSPSSSS